MPLTVTALTDHGAGTNVKVWSIEATNANESVAFSHGFGGTPVVSFMAVRGSIATQGDKWFFPVTPDANEIAVEHSVGTPSVTLNNVQAQYHSLVA